MHPVMMRPATVSCERTGDARPSRRRLVPPRPAAPRSPCPDGRPRRRRDRRAAVRRGPAAGRRPVRQPEPDVVPARDGPGARPSAGGGAARRSSSASATRGRSSRLSPRSPARSDVFVSRDHAPYGRARDRAVVGGDLDGGRDRVPREARHTGPRARGCRDGRRPAVQRVLAVPTRVGRASCAGSSSPRPTVCPGAWPRRPERVPSLDDLGLGDRPDGGPRSHCRRPASRRPPSAGRWVTGRSRRRTPRPATVRTSRAGRRGCRRTCIWVWCRRSRSSSGRTAPGRVGASSPTSSSGASSTPTSSSIAPRSDGTPSSRRSRPSGGREMTASFDAWRTGRTGLPVRRRRDAPARWPPAGCTTGRG